MWSGSVAEPVDASVVGSMGQIEGGESVAYGHLPAGECHESGFGDEPPLLQGKSIIFCSILCDLF